MRRKSSQIPAIAAAYERDQPLPTVCLTDPDDYIPRPTPKRAPKATAVFRPGVGGFAADASSPQEAGYGFFEVGASDRTVLVVDDDASIRFLCRVNLELEGYRVLEATSLAEGRQVLDAEDVDVLLIDVHLAGQDGRDLVRELRAAGARTRVALLTGTIDLRADERAGADALLEKPFQLEVLVGTVRDLESRLDSPIQ